MEQIYLCLDVGGTEIKAGAVSESGELLSGEIRRFPARAKEDADTVVANLAGICLAVGKDCKVSPTGVRLAFPGPFDYENGVSRMRGLDKYDAICGLDLRDALNGRFRERWGACDIRFLNDAAAFGLGEAYFGEVRTNTRALCVPIGTGSGSVFLENGRILDERCPGVPQNGYIYAEPFLDGCIDDHISRRGLMKLSEELLGRPLDGGALAEAAKTGDPGALCVWRVFGNRLADALGPFLSPSGFHPDVLCVGGQIVKSGAFFAAPLQAVCERFGVRLTASADTSLRVMQGLTRI